MRVVVLGAGALGSLYGAWSALVGHEVHLVGRRPHAAAIDREGLRVLGVDGAERRVALGAGDDPGAAGDADVVLLAAKAQDSGPLLDAFRGSPTAVWSVQNGALQAAPLVDRFGAAATGATSMVGATLLAPGVVQHTFGGTTYLGPLTSSDPANVDRVLATLDVATADPPVDPPIVPAVETMRCDDIVAVMWSKAVLATGAMGASVLLRVPYHHVFVEPPARRLFMRIVTDAAEVAACAGVELVDLPGPLQAGSLVAAPLDVALARLAEVGRSMVAGGQTDVRVSMLQSLETGRRLEYQAVFGDLVDLADRHDLDVPVLRAVAEVVQTLDALGQPVGDGARGHGVSGDRDAAVAPAPLDPRRPVGGGSGSAGGAAEVAP